MFHFIRRHQIKKEFSEIELFVSKTSQSTISKMDALRSKILAKRQKETETQQEIPVPASSSGLRFSRAPARDPSDDVLEWMLRNGEKDPEEAKKRMKALTEASFSEKLLAHIRKKSLKEPEVYRKANIDRRLFSKIISTPSYKPSKDTAIALAISLHLSLEETNDLLASAGYILSHSDERDLIIEFFIKKQNYSLIDINLALDLFKQKCIGR